jgi:replicative DNA helicase
VQDEEVLTEIKVLNAVLQNKDKTALFLPSVDDLFTSHGDVWEFVKGYNERYGDLPSLESVQEKYTEFPEYTARSPAEFYLDTLRNEYMENRIESLMLRVADAKKKGASPREIKHKLQDALAKLDRFDNNVRSLEITDFESAARRYDEVREKADAMGGTPGVPTGVDFIDACMPLGMQGGDVMAIIGYPARGKSALGTLFASKSMKKGFKPLIFTLEMTKEAVQDRIFTVMGSGLFSNTELMLGYYNEDDFRGFAKDNGSAAGWIYDGMGVENITPDFMRGVALQHRPDYILLDYMQLAMDNRLSEEMTPRMRNLSLEIKRTAAYLNIPMVVISSATPPDGIKIDGPPNVERSAWSRQLSYDATVAFAVHRHDGSNMYEVLCAKNRYGPLFHGFLDWDMDRGTYTELLDIG